MTPVATELNLIDSIWDDRPDLPCGPVQVHELTHAGVGAREKLDQIAVELKEAKHDALILSMTDSIAWLFNIRGSDIAHTPVPLANAIVHANGHAEIFIASQKLGNAANAHLVALADCLEPEALGASLEVLATSGANVLLDPVRTPAWFEERLKAKGAKVVHGPDPVTTAKAIKNSAEIDGARTAHLRDGVAMTRFLAWLEQNAASGTLDEIAAAKKLEALRAETGKLHDISFDTISGAGPHGAIVHYRVTETSNRALNPGELYLCDSGGQYPDGTTDITRTVAVGAPSGEMRRHYTLVLKGHLAIGRARFPGGTRGVDLDPLARQYLWARGLDYAHGTGHGVGSFLSVHEGPQGISFRSMVKLKPGMIVSNEPGYYLEGAYGIRIENLELVTPPAEIEGGDIPMLGFETLTLAPYARALIDLALLTGDEIAQVDAYHTRVRKKISGGLDNVADRTWLEQATAPLAATRSGEA